MEIWEQTFTTRSGGYLYNMADPNDALTLTTTSENLISRDPRTQWVSVNNATDATSIGAATVPMIQLEYSQTANRIAILNHNMKSFIVSTSSDIASTSAYLTLTSTCDTVTAYWITNSQTSHYLAFPDVASPVSIYIYGLKTMVANNEKAIGTIYISRNLLTFPRTPGAQNYRISRDQVAVNHELSDGGRRVHIIDEKFRASINFSYVSSSFMESLKDVYDSHDQLVFVPFPPTTAGVWDEICFPCQWHGAFNFLNFSDNAIDAGYIGSIDLLETPR